jgi:hypothetical protein
VLGANAGAAGRQDLHLPRQKIPQHLCVFVVNMIYVFCAEITGFVHRQMTGNM